VVAVPGVTAVVGVPVGGVPGGGRMVVVAVVAHRGVLVSGVVVSGDGVVRRDGRLGVVLVIVRVH
jgi:hypothetical protein